jgi:glycosyltransferase involved in cell wall biosynthesis
MYKGQTITVIIPCLNEEEGIQLVLSEVPDFVDEVIVVDNNSTDRTAGVAASMGAKVIAEKMPGYGRAYKRGFGSATGDVIITLDGDHSYPVNGISYLLEAFIHLEADFLNTSRFPVRDPKAMSFKHKVGNLILSFTMSLLFLRWVADSQSGMWVFRRAILEDMQLEADGMAFSEEIKIEALLNPKLRFAEIAILYTSRTGEIKLNPWRDGINNILFLFKKRFAFRKWR